MCLCQIFGNLKLCIFLEYRKRFHLFAMKRVIATALFSRWGNKILSVREVASLVKWSIVWKYSIPAVAITLTLLKPNPRYIRYAFDYTITYLDCQYYSTVFYHHHNLIISIIWLMRKPKFVPHICSAHDTDPFKTQLQI